MWGLPCDGLLRLLRHFWTEEPSSPAVQDSLITISSSCIVALMREAIVLLAIVFFGALPVLGTTISTPAIQDVRFSPPAVPTDLVIPPKVLSDPPAVYSSEARRRGIQGSVIVQGQFDEYGRATVLKVIKGLGYGLDEAALQALKGWRFSLALRNGLPVNAVG